MKVKARDLLVDDVVLSDDGGRTKVLSTPELADDGRVYFDGHDGSKRGVMRNRIVADWDVEVER